MNIRSILFAVVACSIALSATACASRKNNFKDLVKNVESYHKDLVFQRYEIAAKNITPIQRAAWLEAIKAQNMHFADIEIMSTMPCENMDVVDKEEKERCAVIISQVQWYSEGSPSVHSATVSTTWQFDEKEKDWRIVEQAQQ